MSFNFLNSLLENAETLKQELKEVSKKTTATSTVITTTVKTTLKNSKEISNRISSPLDSIYDTLTKGTPIRGKGLSHIVALADSKETSMRKLKGKFFFLRKNEIKRGKKNINSNLVSRKKAKKLGIFELSKTLKYKDVLPMNTFW